MLPFSEIIPILKLPASGESASEQRRTKLKCYKK